MVAALAGCFVNSVGGSPGGTPQAVASPTNLYGYKTRDGTVTTGSYATVTVYNLNGPYSYKWAWDDGDETVYPNNPTQVSTRFSGQVSTNGEKHASFICTVTGAGGVTVVTPPIYVQLSVGIIP